MNDFDTFRREAEAALRVALQWFFLAVPMGLLCGFLGTLFHLAIEHATELRAAQPWLLFLLPVAGLLITALYKVTKCAGVGTNNVLRAVQSGEVMPSFFVGATFGCVVGPLLGLPAGFAAAVGLVSIVCGAPNALIPSLRLACALFSMNMSISKVCSSFGASLSRYSIRAESSAISAFSQKGSLDAPLGGVVFFTRLSISFSTSGSSRI